MGQRETNGITAWMNALLLDTPSVSKVKGEEDATGFTDDKVTWHHNARTCHRDNRQTPKRMPKALMRIRINGKKRDLKGHLLS
jgi:hypothetical protein